VGRDQILRLAGILALAGLAVSGPLPGQQTAPTPPERNRPLLGLIEQFFARPLAHSELRRAFYDSANARADISIEITGVLTPWYCYGDDAKEIKALDDLLTAGYLAGNLEAQLRSGLARDQPAAGMAGALRVYDALQAKIRNYFVPELDQWRTRRASGGLFALADSLSHSQDYDCPAKKTKRYPGKVQLRPVPDSVPPPVSRGAT